MGSEDAITLAMKSQAPINESMQVVLEELEKQKLPSQVHMVCEQILCHSENRNNLGLNPYNVHKVGKDVQKVGAKKEALRSVAFELPPHDNQRSLQIAFDTEDLAG